MWLRSHCGRSTFCARACATMAQLSLQEWDASGFARTPEGELRSLVSFLTGIVIFLMGGSFILAAQQPVLVQGSLTAAGSKPFHLKATITEGHDPSPKAEVEMEWLAPNQWRRTIKSDDFSQTLIVNGDKIFDQHSDDYFPLGANCVSPRSSGFRVPDTSPPAPALLRSSAIGCTWRSGRCGSPIRS